MTAAHFTAWRGCSCVQIEDAHADLADTCPCHGTSSLGTDTIPGHVKRGHYCTPEDAR